MDACEVTVGEHHITHVGTVTGHHVDDARWKPGLDQQVRQVPEQVGLFGDLLEALAERGNGHLSLPGLGLQTGQRPVYAPVLRVDVAAAPQQAAGLGDVALPGPDGVLVLDLTDPLAVGRELIVESANRIFVERATPVGRGDLRSASWAIPAG